jgi:hypothetical protein
MCMYDKEELKEELEQELQWVKYRMKILDIIDTKLLQMREIAEQAKQVAYTTEVLEILNEIINDLAVQVRALDVESRKIEDGEILE